MTLAEYLKTPKGKVYTYLFAAVGFDLRAALEVATKSVVSLQPDLVEFDDYTNGFFIIFATSIPIGERLQFVEASMSTHALADLRALYTALPVEYRRALSAAESAIGRAVALAIESEPPNMAPIDAYLRGVQIGTLPQGSASFAEGPARPRAPLSVTAQAVIGAAAAAALVLLFKSTRD
jgi:hypothetical protein